MKLSILRIFEGKDLVEVPTSDAYDEFRQEEMQDEASPPDSPDERYNFSGIRSEAIVAKMPTANDFLEFSQALLKQNSPGTAKLKKKKKKSVDFGIIKNKMRK